MAKKIQSIRGMHDILPTETAAWQHVETELRELMAAYAYREIRMPLIEHTGLFARSIGEVTDIVEKEMYTFEDRNGDSLTLRPEGTASCVRAGIEHGLLHNQQHRLWYMGPMFRHERPQKGRYRQFHQIGVEAFGLTGPDIDAELILMAARLWKRLGLADDVQLEINTLGTAEAREEYRRHLVDYFSYHEAQLDDESQDRLHRNPMRILDSKNPDMQDLIESAPRLHDHLDEESRAHFRDLLDLLEAAGVPYHVNHRLVRGLDYYSRTVFEWTTDKLGAQGTVCAGGRYDGLVKQLGGRATPAAGFAIGIERLIALLEDQEAALPTGDPHVYLAMLGDTAQRHGLVLAERLRDALPGMRLQTHCGGGGMKAQMKRADRSGAEIALILGESEVEEGTVTLKPLRGGEQTSIPQSELVDTLDERLPVTTGPAKGDSEQ